MKNHPIIKTILWMLLISVGILIIVFIGMRFYSRHGKVYELPDLVNHPLDSIQSSNNLDLGFVVLDSTYREGTSGGTILTQDPKGGTVIKKGRKVYITVAAYSPDDAIIPDLTGGVTLRTAISQLGSVGLRGGTLKFVDSPFRNTVIEMTHKGKIVSAGQKLSNGAKIDLVVGIGEDPSQAYSIVPFVIGKKAERVRQEILSASFNIGIENFDGVKDRYNAVVYKQQPAYDGTSRLHFGTRVNLWYCDADQQKINQIVNDYKPDPADLPQVDDQTSWPIDDLPIDDPDLNW